MSSRLKSCHNCGAESYAHAQVTRGVLVRYYCHTPAKSCYNDLRGHYWDDVAPGPLQLVQPGAIPKHQLLQVTLMLDDGTVEPGPTDEDFDPTKVLGLGRYLGGTKHGIRQITPDFHTVPLIWRVSVSQFHYEQGTVLVQKLEIHSA